MTRSYRDGYVLLIMVCAVVSALFLFVDSVVDAQADSPPICESTMFLDKEDCFSAEILVVPTLVIAIVAGLLWLHMRVIFSIACHVRFMKRGSRRDLQ